ncbi:MAG: thiamine-phosphate kinase [Planctomycetia bacterium]
METDFVEWLLGRLPADPRLEVPAGDDAAVLRPPAMRRTVITVDMLTAGVDFIVGPDCTPRQVGHKSLAVNLSDLAAMGARPEAAVVAVALPRHGGMAIAEGLHEGIASLAAKHGVALAGGDTNAWDGPLVVSVTAIGSVAPGQAWRRDGARAGDLIVVTGPCGGSLRGRHLHVSPRCREAAAIRERCRVHAAIDISDGLSLDLDRMMRASGVGCAVRLADIPIHDDATLMSRQPGDGRTPLEHALGDGEDFELLLAMPPDDARSLVAAPPLGLRPAIIGTVTTEPGLVAVADDGTLRRLEPKGFLHAFDA